MSEAPQSAGSHTADSDPAITRAIGLHHTIPTAVADLVDNSLDAGADHVLVRFVRDGSRITGLRIIDDGKGMSSGVIDAAMTYGSARAYSSSDLGHFGVGMKASSLSQATTLLVWSKANGHAVQGRMIQAGSGTVSVVDSDEAEAIFASTNPRFPFATGTIIEWSGITTFLMSADEDEQVGWLETTIDDVRNHLGVVFHRLLGSVKKITIDVYDVHSRRAGAPRSVSPVDPFGYSMTGATGYPRNIPVDLPAHRTTLTAHIWPARSGVPEYRLYGAPGRDRQGLYFYRNDRLLQVGGWNGLWHSRPDFGPARIAIELDEALMQHVRINPEKAGVRLDATAAAALQLSLASVITEASVTTKAARTRTTKPISAIEPSSGLPEDVLDAFGDAFAFADGQEPVAMRWRVLARDQFFEVDLKTRTLWVNARFRTDLVGRRSRDNTDEPVIKTLLYLLVHQMFSAQRLSPKQLESIAAWQEVLVSAMAGQRKQSGVDG